MTSTWGKPLLWVGICVAMLFSLITPIGVLTAHFILVPLLVAVVVSETRKFAIVYAAALGVISAALGGIGLMMALVSLFYLVPAVIMGRQYRKRAAPGNAVIAGILGFIGTSLLVLLITFLSGFDFTGAFTEFLRSDADVLAMMTGLFGSREQLELAFRFITDMIPMMIIVFAVYTTLLAHWIGRKILTRIWAPVDKLRPMKDWRLPRSLVFCYLIVLVLELLVPLEPGSTLSVILLNSVPILTYALALQAVGFLFFLTDAKGWNRVLPIASLVLLPFPGLSQLLAWLGVIDISFPIRDRLAMKR